MIDEISAYDVHAYDTTSVSTSFEAIQFIEGCLCSMSMEVWDIDNTTLVWSTTRLLVRDRRVQSL